MKTNTLKSYSLLPAFLLLFGAFLTSTIALAQNEETTVSTSKTVVKSSKENTLKKKVEVRYVGDKPEVTVTTINGSNKNVEKYSGEEAEEYLENSAEIIIEEAIENGFEFQGNDDEVRVIIMNSNMKMDGETKMIFVSDDDDIIKFTDAENIEVTTNDGVTTINVNYANNKDGEIQKVIVFDETEMVKSVEEMEDLLESMDIDVDMDITMEDESGKQIKSIIVTKTIMIEDDGDKVDRNKSSMLKDFEVSPNPSNGQIKVNFEPVNKGKVIVTLLDMKGNVLFTDSYNGKTSYSKYISINGYKGFAMLKIEQENDVEVRKIVIE